MTTTHRPEESFQYKEWVDTIGTLQEVQTLRLSRRVAAYLMYEPEAEQERVKARIKDWLRHGIIMDAMRWMEQHGDENHFIGKTAYHENWVPDTHPRYKECPTPLPDYVQEYELTMTITIFRRVTQHTVTLERNDNKNETRWARVVALWKRLTAHYGVWKKR